MADTSKIDIEIVFTYGLLAAISLFLYSLYAVRDIEINPNSKFTKKKIYEIQVLSGNIYLICFIYFEIDTLDNYQTEKTKENENYVIANALSVAAQVIRLSTLYAYSPKDEQVEDIF